MTDAELLDLAISRSGLTPGEFARRKLVRPARTVKRWLNREHPIPRIVLTWLIVEVMPDEPITRARIRRAKR